MSQKLKMGAHFCELENAGERQLLHYLSEVANDEGRNCFASDKYLRERCGCDALTFRRRKKGLLKSGIVTNHFGPAEGARDKKPRSYWIIHTDRLMTKPPCSSNWRLADAIQRDAPAAPSLFCLISTISYAVDLQGTCALSASQLGKHLRRCPRAIHAQLAEAQTAGLLFWERDKNNDGRHYLIRLSQKSFPNAFPAAASLTEPASCPGNDLATQRPINAVPVEPFAAAGEVNPSINAVSVISEQEIGAVFVASDDGFPAVPAPLHDEIGAVFVDQQSSSAQFLSSIRAVSVDVSISDVYGTYRNGEISTSPLSRSEASHPLTETVISTAPQRLSRRTLRQTCIQLLAEHHRDTEETGDFEFGAEEGRVLNAFLDSQPSLTPDKFKQWLKNRQDSQYQRQRLRFWLMDLAARYGKGPTDRSSYPLDTSRSRQRAMTSTDHLMNAWASLDKEATLEDLLLPKRRPPQPVYSSRAAQATSNFDQLDRSRAL